MQLLYLAINVVRLPTYLSVAVISVSTHNLLTSSPCHAVVTVHVLLFLIMPSLVSTMYCDLRSAIHAPTLT